MHIYFVGIGGTGVGPLALIASQAGYDVSGSDAKHSEYTDYLVSKGIDVEVETPFENEKMAHTHAVKPIDWVVSVSSITRNNPNEAHLAFARQHNIRVTERDACLNEIINKHGLKMIAAAGTHGKTTTAAMIIWTMQQLGLPISFSVGAKTTFSDMGHFDPSSEYFVYECDEFHRNFLHFSPYISVISGITWDHHEVFPTQDDYNQAFSEFISQSSHTVLWQNDFDHANLLESPNMTICRNDQDVSMLKIPGLYNRRNAWLVAVALHRLTGASMDILIDILSRFPGTQRRMEELAPGLFTDYAHTPEKIVGCMSVAQEIAAQRGKAVVVVYEPLTNRRQHFMKDLYTDCFSGAKTIYWVPSYLAREDPNQHVLTPEELITKLGDPSIATPAALDDSLWNSIQNELADSIVVCMSGGGGNSLDEWLRSKVRGQHQ